MNQTRYLLAAMAFFFAMALAPSSASACSDAGLNCHPTTVCSSDTECYGGECVDALCVCPMLPPPDPCQSCECLMGGYCPDQCLDGGVGSVDASTGGMDASTSADAGAADAGPGPAPAPASGCSAGSGGSPWLALGLGLLALSRRRVR